MTWRSQAKTIEAPTPAAMPLTPATTGLGRPTMLRMMVLAPTSVESSKFVTGSSPVRSTPALNAAPVPVSSTTRTASSSAAVVRASTSPAAISSLMALKASGRSKVTRRTPSAVSTRRSLMGCTVTAVPTDR